MSTGTSHYGVEDVDELTFLKYGRVPFQSQVEFGPPSVAQPSYSSDVPRIKAIPLMALDPPTRSPTKTISDLLFIPA